MEHLNELNTATVEQPAPEQHAKGESALLQLDGTMLVIATSFVLFAIIMQKVFYAPLTKIREQRTKHINSIKEAADKALADSEALNSSYSEKINTARKHVSDSTSKTLAESNQEKMKIIEDKKQQVAEFLESGRKQIQQEKAQSLEQLMQNLETYARDISGKILEDETPVTIGEHHERSY